MPNRTGFGYKVKRFIDFDIFVDFVPDGHTIDEENKEVTLYEHVTTNDLTKRKLSKLAKFWF